MQLGYPHLHFQSTDSTNAQAKRLAQDGAPHGTTVSAAFQTAGRGRNGNSWTAPEGSSLLYSLLLRGPVDQLTPLRIGLATCNLVAAHFADPSSVQLKWPNDVLIDGRKVAGILVEANPGQEWTVVGVGLNAALELDSVPLELRDTVATLDLAQPDIAALVSDLTSCIAAALKLNSQDLSTSLNRLDALAGHDVTWRAGGVAQQGRAAGITVRGALRVEQGEGITELTSGEVAMVRSTNGL